MSAATREQELPLLRRLSRSTEGEEMNAADDALSLRVKVSGGDGREFRVSVASAGQVADLRRAVLRVVGADAEGKHVRLIAAGRLLAPDEARLSSFKVVADNSFVHCVITNAPPQRLAAGPPAPSVVPSEVVDDDESSDEDPENRRQRRGFDRLREGGMTRSEVAALRAYFAPQVRRHMANMARAALGGNAEDDGSTGGSSETVDAEAEQAAQRERLLQSEEDWMAAQGESSEFAVNTSLGRGRRARRSGSPLLGGEGTPAFRLGGLGAMEDTGSDVGSTRDFLFGLVMGFFLGFIMLFWLWEGAVPQRQKLGILTGVLLQLLLNFARRAWAEEAAAT